MKKTLIIGAVLLLVVLAALGVASRPRANSPAASGEKAVPAPDFSLSKSGGGMVALADYRGKKAVILDFWATWCPECRRDIPHQETFYEKYKDKVEVIGIDLQEEPSLVARVARQYGITYPVALDPQAQASQAYDVQYTNYHVLIDKGGNIVKTVPGDISESDFTSLIGS